MGRLVDLTKKPYNLNAAQIAWVENTIAEMSDEEKVGQLFINLFFFGDDVYSGNNYTNKEILEKFHIGGARYHGGNKHDVQQLLNSLQQDSKIPLLIAANCDSGGNGACKDGVYIASAAQAEATGSTDSAFNAGLVSAREAKALGVNVNFDPCVDILFNWRNTIVNTRAYGTTADQVIAYSSAYIDGYHTQSDMITCIKHWPGDGIEERDQHLVLGVNDQSVDEWEASYGKVYRHHIARGVDMIMAAHFVLPAYQKQLNPALRDAELMPASLSKELTLDLLKDKLDFNGMVVTDATHMVGMACMMSRRDYVPASIAAGCDMFLFFNNIDEDFGYMLDGYKNGVISEERMHDALRRILGLKAKLNLHQKQAEGMLLAKPEALADIGCDEHLAMRQGAADKGITLVKDTQHLLPINPKDHKRIGLYYLKSNNEGVFETSDEIPNQLMAEFEQRGFSVELLDGASRVKGRIDQFKNKYDVILTAINVVGYAAENNYRVSYPAAMSASTPWYIREVPTIVASFNFTTHLHDFSAAKTYINAYNANPDNIRAFVDKVTGASPFNCGFNDNVWTDKWEAKL